MQDTAYGGSGKKPIRAYQTFRFVQRGELIEPFDEIRDERLRSWRPVHRKHVGQKAVVSDMLRREVVDVIPAARALVACLKVNEGRAPKDIWPLLAAYVNEIEDRLLRHDVKNTKKLR